MSVTEMLLQERKKRISMVSMNSQESGDGDRNEDKCKITQYCVCIMNRDTMCLNKFYHQDTVALLSNNNPCLTNIVTSIVWCTLVPLGNLWVGFVDNVLSK